MSRLLDVLIEERKLLEKAVEAARLEVEKAVGAAEGYRAILEAATTELEAFDSAISSLPKEYVPSRTSEALRNR